MAKSMWTALPTYLVFFFWFGAVFVPAMGDRYITAIL